MKHHEISHEQQKNISRAAKGESAEDAQTDKKVITNINAGGWLSPAVPWLLANLEVSRLFTTVSYLHMSLFNNSNDNNKHTIMALLLCKYFTHHISFNSITK